MAVSDAYREFVLDQLAGLGTVTARRMFGGAGLYCDGLFFAVLDNDQVFFKVDDTTRPAYVAHGSGPFAPMPDREQAMMGYFEVPATVLDDRDALVVWARGALGVARARATMPRAARRAESAGRQVLRAEHTRVTPAAILKPYPAPIRALANRLRALVRRAVPTLRESAYPRWKAVGFRHAEAGYVCGVFPAKDRVRLIFEHGGALDDPDGVLEGAGRVKQVRYVTVRRPSDIRVRALTRLVRAAVAHGLS